MLTSMVILLIFSLLAVVLSWFYFGRYRMTRPPLGVFNLWDVVFIMAGILLIPYLYLLLPRWLVTVLLGLAAIGILYAVFEPVGRLGRKAWLPTLLISAVTLVAWWQFGARSPVFLLSNNVVQILTAVGVANVWAQGGLKARDAAILGAALIIYDLVFTSFLPLMGDIFTQLEGLPFAPVVAWPVDDQINLIGLGDLLLASVFPIVMLKAYGRTAGLVALAMSVAALAGVMVLPFVVTTALVFPVMIVLGPLMVIQYLYWRSRLGQERTMQRFWQEDAPIRNEVSTRDPGSP